MISTILTWIGGAAVLFLIAFLAGAQWRNTQHKLELAQAKAVFEQTVAAANAAYAGQKVIDDAELAALKALVDTTPTNPAIALNKDAAGRIGAIR